MKTKKTIYIYNPLNKDPLSKTRGLGRYTKLLLDTLKTAKVISSFSEVKTPGSVLILPYIDLLKKPYILPSSTLNIAVIHDIIKLKYPKAFPKGVVGNAFLFLNKLLLNKYSYFVTDSFASKQDIIKFLKIPAKKIRVIYPPIEEALFKKPQTFNINLPENFCLYVGDATWNKNLVNLAKAIKLINLTCVFVGKIWEKAKKTKLPNHPELRELKSFLKEIENDKRFVLLGFVKDEQLAYLYNKARVNVLVSRDEGFGYSPLEAGAQKTPSVVSNIPVFKETLKDSALFVNPKDPYEIANAIGELYFNNSLNKNLGEKAYKRAIIFNKRNFRKELLQFLNKL